MTGRFSGRGRGGRGRLGSGGGVRESRDGFGGGGGGGRGRGMHTNPCLTMHQPWASLLVYGIKRIEGRSWPAPLSGRLWIHAASKVPEPETIKAMEDFYREIYAVNEIKDIKFPEHYPVSRLLGCVEVVGCVKCEELVCWEEVPESVRLEGLTDFCWLCENPQKLLVPFEMRGYQGVYNLERKIYDAAIRGLCPVKGPLPVKFPLSDTGDAISLKPGSLSSPINSPDSTAMVRTPNVSAAIAGARAAAVKFPLSDTGDAISLKPGSLSSPINSPDSTAMVRTPNVSAAIAGARAAATQFSRKDQATMSTNDNNKLAGKSELGLLGTSRIEYQKGSSLPAPSLPAIFDYAERRAQKETGAKSVYFGQIATRVPTSQSGTSGKIFSAALNELRFNQDSRTREQRAQNQGFLRQ